MQSEAVDFKKKYLKVMRDRKQSMTGSLRKIVKESNCQTDKLVSSSLYRDYKIIKMLNLT